MIPPSLVHYSWFHEGAKLVALQQLGDEMLAGDATRVGHSMLRRELPRFVAGGGSRPVARSPAASTTSARG